MIDLAELKPCPFCGADAEIKWVLDGVGVQNGHGGKAIRVSCSRDGECPSPSWHEVCNEHEDDAACLYSVTTFWNTRAEDWSPDEMNKLRVRLVKAEKEARVAKVERDRAMRVCEQMAEQIDTKEPRE